MRVFISLLWMSFSSYYLHINNLTANLTPKLKSFVTRLSLLWHQRPQHPNTNRRKAKQIT